MYSIVFGVLLCIILGWKAFKLVKNRKSVFSYEGIDQYLKEELEEGGPHYNDN